jgi:hypothetical protein
MITNDESRQQLIAELIDRSAEIDQLLSISRQNSADLSFDPTQKLEELRAKQRETTEKLHASENLNSNVWENIGDGG